MDFYFHCLRHNFTTGLVENNLPSKVITDIVGWSNENMIQIYNDQEVDDVLGDYFDENGIKEVEKKTIKDL